MKIVVIDGQGGGMGRALVEKIREAAPEAEILAVGANAMATAAMLRAGASAGATGENAVVYNCAKADVIAGATGILLANGMHGEISPRMAQAVSGSEAMKFLIPTERCSLRIMGVKPQPLDAAAQEVAQRVRQMTQTTEE